MTAVLTYSICAYFTASSGNSSKQEDIASNRLLCQSMKSKIGSIFCLG